MPKVSIIIPTYNRASLLKRAIKSVLAQTFKDLELIIIDDNSNDCTEDIVKKYMKFDSRVKYIQNEVNLGGGAAATRNKGIDIARRKYCAFLDDDDEWREDKLEKQLNVLKKNDYSVIGSKKLVLKNCRDSSENLLQDKDYNDCSDFEEISLQDALSGRLHISPSTLITKTEYLIEIGGFDEKLKASVGYDLNVRLINNFGKGAIINEKLTIIHQEHEYQRVSTSKKSINGAWQSYNKHHHLMSLKTKRKRLMSIHRKSILMDASSIKEKFFNIIKLIPYIDLLLIWIIKTILQKIIKN